jgi:hypothetical protein
MIKITNGGVDADITARVNNDLAELTKSILNVRASTSSIRYMSLQKIGRLAIRSRLGSFRCGAGKANLENRLRMRPAGVVSKKLIGLRKIAIAILSCSFRDACVKRNHQLQFGRKVLHTQPRTSMEQKIQRIKVWITTKAAEPTPNAKYIPTYLPTSGFMPCAPLVSDHCFNHTLPPMGG